MGAGAARPSVRRGEHRPRRGPRRRHPPLARRLPTPHARWCRHTPAAPQARPGTEQQYAPPTPFPGAGEGPYITPLVRKLAAEHGVDLGSVEGYRRWRPDTQAGRGRGVPGECAPAGAGARPRLPLGGVDTRRCRPRRAPLRPAAGRAAMPPQGSAARAAAAAAAACRGSPGAGAARLGPVHRAGTCGDRAGAAARRRAIAAAGHDGTDVAPAPGDRSADGRFAAHLRTAHHRGRGGRHEDRPAPPAGEGRLREAGRRQAVLPAVLRTRDARGAQDAPQAQRRRSTRSRERSPTTTWSTSGSRSTPSAACSYP